MKVVLGMVRNPVSGDFRVMKTARGAAEAGYGSLMLGRGFGSHPAQGGEFGGVGDCERDRSVRATACLNGFG